MKKVAEDVAEQEKKVCVQKRKGSEIDEIFAANKRKRLETESKAEAETKAKAKLASAKKKEKSAKSRRLFEQTSFAAGTSGPRKKTADGLALFSEEELGIGKPDAGGTALCPFDCDCCF
ncbi:hypothetical protein AAHA92_31245 [Salvia divinorum]|uniref:DUF1764-domain-containing protein n=1 Tax=Salvia divinorum TaxID=28513 RepID=A0ABD1FTJ3_SALDI